jgi:D-3-phosphoglycerate dehydrogenase
VARVLVSEKLAQTGLDLLTEAGHDVDVRLGLSPEELTAAVEGAQALIVRSATTVTAEVLAAGSDLVVVGRAGIGLDNVDVAAATERGVMVVNAPQSNILSAAEQAMALLLAQARNIPQAHAALVAGKWERSKWEGVELHGKTLGVVGGGGGRSSPSAPSPSACGSWPTTPSSRPTGPVTWVSSSWRSTSSWPPPTS